MAAGDTTSPTPEEASGAPPIKPRPVKIEGASETELLDGIEAMFDDADAETNLLHSDGATGLGKMDRVILWLVELLLIAHLVFLLEKLCNFILAS